MTSVGSSAADRGRACGLRGGMGVSKEVTVRQTDPLRPHLSRNLSQLGSTSGFTRIQPLVAFRGRTADLLAQVLDQLCLVLPKLREKVGRRPGLSPNPPKDTDGRREESGRGVRELQGK